MDRVIVYPGALPQDTDILQPQRNTLIALGALAEAILGQGTWIDGLSCVPGTGSLSVMINPGKIFVSTPTDPNAFGSLSADNHQTTKFAAMRDAATFNTPTPSTAGQSINYLIQIRHLETDGNPTVLPYFNPAAPSVNGAAVIFSSPLNGAGGVGSSQNTSRTAVCDVQILAGVAAATGSQLTPAAGAGYTPLWVVTVANGQSTINTNNIQKASTAPSQVSVALLQKLLTVDGVGSGLDADKIQGNYPSAFRKAFAGALVNQTNVQIDGTTASAAIQFASNYDTNGGIFNGSNSTRLTVPSGIHYVKLTACVPYSMSSSTQAMAFIAKNGSLGSGAIPGLPSEFATFTSGSTEVSGAFNLQSAVIQVNPGDYFEVYVNGIKATASQSWFSMELIQ